MIVILDSLEKGCALTEPGALQQESRKIFQRTKKVTVTQKDPCVIGKSHRDL